MEGVNWPAQLVNSGIIAATFLVLMAFLDAVVFRPVLRLLDEREARTRGALDEARALEAEAAAAASEYEAKLAAGRDRAAAEKALVRKEALDRERELLEAARAEARARLDQLEREIAEAAERARRGLAAQARDLARVIAEKVLGRPVSVASLLAVLVPAILPGPALAAAAHGGFFDTPLGGFVAHVVNFVILLAILVRFVGPALRNYLVTRREALERLVQEAAAAKASAEARAREYRERLARVDAEIERLREQYRADGEAEKARILAEAERAAERLRRQAEQTAEQELAKARLALREEAARLATQLAEQALRRELTPADQARLVQDFVARIPAAVAGDGGRL